MREKLRDILKPTPILTANSAFTCAGIGLQGYERAKFTITGGIDFDTRFSMMASDNYKAPDGSSIINLGHPEIPVDVTTVIGSSIRAFQKRKFGTDTVHLFEQGPTCDDYSPLNQTADFGRRDLMLEALRLISEVKPLVAVIEESDRFLSAKHKDISEPYFKIAKKMPYRSAYKVMNAINYGSHQSRKRFIHVFVHEILEKEPIFPAPLSTPPIRVRDFLDIDRFFSGHFTDAIKTRNNFMCATTTGSPQIFEKDGVRREPTFDELMKCCDLDPETFILRGTKQAKKEALGNLMAPNLAYEIGKTIREQILGYNRYENGLWIPDGM